MDLSDFQPHFPPLSNFCSFLTVVLAAADCWGRSTSLILRHQGEQLAFLPSLSFSLVWSDPPPRTYYDMETGCLCSKFKTYTLHTLCCCWEAQKNNSVKILCSSSFNTTYVLAAPAFVQHVRCVSSKLNIALYEKLCWSKIAKKGFNKAVF